MMGLRGGAARIAPLLNESIHSVVGQVLRKTSWGGSWRRLGGCNNSFERSHSFPEGHLGGGDHGGRG